MTNIKFGTDGWRAIIADEYTLANLSRVAHATAAWIKKKKENPLIVVGYDCRFGGQMFAEFTAKIFCEQGIKVILSDNFVSTPMISFAAKALNTDLGIIITASHNPPLYNGYKIKAPYGGPSLQADITEVESHISESAPYPEASLQQHIDGKRIEYADLETLYVDEVKSKFDLAAIEKSGIVMAYDAMFGSGQNVVSRVLKNSVLINCEHNPTFNGVAPEPLEKNLKKLSQTIKDSGDIDIGLAVDGDADRIALFDQNGNYIDSHHVILLLIHYLVKYKQMTGKIVIAFSVSNKIKKLCDHYRLDYEVTKIGFKYICEIMIKEDTLLGGEESGGIAVKGHIPERDGIWDGLIILEFLAKSGKKLTDLIEEIYEIVGSFYYERNDLRLEEQKKLEIIENCNQNAYSAFGDFTVEQVETVDGFKFYLGNDRTVMIRTSGTEPVLRIYGEGKNKSEVSDILKSTIDTILK